MLEGKRIVFRSPGRAEVEPFTLDDRDLGPTEVVVRTRVTLISPGTELANLHDRLPMHVDQPRQYPLTQVGYANIGTVVAAGADVGVQPGERVYTMAYHASVARIDAANRFCVPVPASLADDHAVFTRLAVVSMTTMRTTFARGGDGVAVVGLGLVGNLAAQVFQAVGARVRAFEASAARRQIAERCGIRSVLTPDDMASVARQHRLVVEATGSATALASAIDLAQNGGEIVMIGAPWGGDENSVPSSRLTRPIFHRFLRLRSGSEWEIPRQPVPLVADSMRANIATALEWLQDGRLQVSPLITHQIAPDEIQRAYDGLLHAKDEYLGVVIRWAE